MTPGVVATVATFAAIAILYAGSAAMLRWLRDPFLRAAGPMILAAGGGLGIVLPAFTLYEPQHDGERLGITLQLLALAGLVLAVTWAWRAARMLIASRRTIHAWTLRSRAVDDRRWPMEAITVDTGAPIVAVGGILRPRLYIDRWILEHCTPAELEAIAAHEAAHVSRRDNLRRLLVGACSGPSSAAAAAWRESAEFAADARAARSDQAALDLAAALLRISRMRTHRPLDAALVSTIHDAGTIEARVRRLVGRQTAGATRPGFPILWAAAVPIVMAAPSILKAAHQGAELLVRHLP